MAKKDKAITPTVDQASSNAVLNTGKLRLHQRDALDRCILKIYARAVPNYAVYATADGVYIHFADDPKLAESQRARLAPLLPLRGEISELLGRWRRTEPETEEDEAQLVRWLSIIRGRAQRQSSALKIYERRVADAMVLALDGSAADAVALLTTIRDDLQNFQATQARLILLSIAGIIAFGAAALAIGMSTSSMGLTRPARLISIAFGAGALGAFFSIATASSHRALRSDSRLAEAVLRLAIGGMSAGLLQTLLASGIVTLGFGRLIIAGGELPPSVETIMAAGFLAGFAERLVPALMARAPGVGVIAGPPPSTMRTAALEDMRQVLGTSMREAMTGPEIGASVRDAISGPELVRFDGSVAATIERGGHSEGWVSLALRFSSPASHGAPRIIIADGATEPIVDFTVECEPLGSPIHKVSREFKVPTIGEFVTPPISVRLPPATETLWIEIRQRGRTIQTFDVDLAPEPRPSDPQ